MAAYGVVARKHATLVASTVDTVTMSADGAQTLEVVNHGTTAIYFTVDGTVPTVAGDETYPLAPAAGQVRRLSVPSTATDLVVKLISSGTPTYSLLVS